VNTPVEVAILCIDYSFLEMVKLQHISDTLDNTTGRININQVVGSFRDIITTAASPCTRRSGARQSGPVTPQPPLWWSTECQVKKTAHNRAWKHYKQSPTTDSYAQYHEARRAYTNTGVTISPRTEIAVLSSCVPYKHLIQNCSGDRSEQRKVYISCQTLVIRNYLSILQK
jgi:hypothetical protein